MRGVFATLAPALLGLLAPAPNPIIIDVAAEFGNVSFQSIRGAMQQAQHIVGSGKSATIFLKAGHHSIDMSGGSLFNMSGVVPAAGHRLVVAGAGMYETTISTRTHGNDVIHSHSSGARGQRHGSGHTAATMWRRVSFVNMTFARTGQTTTQGRLVNAQEAGIEVEVSDGFPPLDEIMVDTYPATPSMWFRRYTFGTRGLRAPVREPVPRLVTDRYNNSYWKPLLNQQVPFSCCNATGNMGCPHSATAWTCPDVRRVAGGDRRWRLTVKKWPAGELQRYKDAVRDPSQRIAIKIKHGGQAYRLQGGDDVEFFNVRWLGHSRGAVIDTSNVAFRNTRVDRLPPPTGASEMPLLASNAGGPQILGDTQPVYNLTIVNHTSTATGDDALALFNVKSGLVIGCHIEDAFGRGILVCSSGTVRLSANTLVRNPLFNVNASSYARCLCTSNPHAGPQLPQCIYPNASR